MNKNLHTFLIKGLSLIFCIGSLLSASVSSAQVTTLFTDYYNRVALTPGGTPSAVYVSTLGVGGTGSIVTAATATAPATINDINGENDYRLKLNGGASTGTEILMSSMSGIVGYNAILNQNTQPITWSFNIRHNRNQTTMSGFAPGKYGVAAVLACDKANPTDLAAKGYALVMGNVAGVPGSTYDLVSFTGGILDIGSVATGYTATTTPIITGIPALTGIRDVLSVKITYTASNNSWSMLQKWDTSPATGTVALYNDPAFAATVCGAGDTVDSAGFVGNSLPNFGFLLNHGGTATTTVSLTVDHYKVVKGTPTATSFYLAANSDCTNRLNWGTNTDGSGSNPPNFTSDNQTFKIYNSGAFLSTDWLVSGSASSVVLGDGAAANALTFPATASFVGVLNVSANTNLTVSSLTSNFIVNSIDTNSTVTFDGADTQDVPAAAYGNLNIFTQGTVGAKAAGVISVGGTFTIAAGSIMNMDSSKLSSVNIVTGSGTLKTKNPNSTALPSGIDWPFDIYYNYTSANSTQSIAGGNYINLNTTGAATGSPRIFNSDLSVSGSFVTGLGVMTAANRITFNGAGAQTLESNFPPATALIIANTSTAGLSLSAAEIVPDATNLELAGNLNADFNENFGTLSLLDNSILTLGATDHSVAFTNSSAINPGPADFWIAGKTLTVKGWTGTPGSSGTNGKLFVGLNDTTGLTATQLSQITFEGYSGAMILASGEVVPVSMMGVSNPTFENFTYYPNPVSNTLMLANSIAISEVAVYNFIGQKVLMASPNALVSSIDMSGLANSIYVVEVVCEGNKQTFKVVKE
jgi:hypothetical protein